MLLPKDPNSGKDVIMEIRAGTGGEEAALFAADLFRMYSRYADIKGWKIEYLSVSATGIGGYKEIIFSVRSPEAYDNLKFESGGHRVQRVPTTEAGGRIHTSAVTVAVMPEAEENEIEIKPGRAAHRRVPLVRARRPVRQHDRFGGAHHPPSHGHGGDLPGREVAAQEQDQGAPGAARPPA